MYRNQSFDFHPIEYIDLWRYSYTNDGYSSTTYTFPFQTSSESSPFSISDVEAGMSEECDKLQPLLGADDARGLRPRPLRPIHLGPFESTQYVLPV